MMCDYSRFAHRAFRHGFGFMAGAGRFFGPGEVRLALLSLLADEPMHGYQLMRRLEERSGGIYRASAGTVRNMISRTRSIRWVACSPAAARNAALTSR